MAQIMKRQIVTKNNVWGYLVVCSWENIFSNTGPGLFHEKIFGCHLVRGHALKLSNIINELVCIHLGIHILYFSVSYSHWLFLLKSHAHMYNSISMQSEINRLTFGTTLGIALHPRNNANA
jgi:hypothetical protein